MGKFENIFCHHVSTFSDVTEFDVYKDSMTEKMKDSTAKVKESLILVSITAVLLMFNYKTHYIRL